MMSGSTHNNDFGRVGLRLHGSHRDKRTFRGLDVIA